VNRRYFDWAATALPDPIVDTNPAVFGNPSSRHEEGRLARELLEKSRARCAAVLGIKPEQLYFTSGGTESNAIVLYSLLTRQKKVRFLYSAVEHPSVRQNCLRLERLGLAPAVIGVERDGRVSPAQLARALGKAAGGGGDAGGSAGGGARFAAIMAVNNETGAVMDMKALSEVIRSGDGPPVHFHSDIVQAAGKVPLDIHGWDLDSAAVSAHKLGGPRGIGLLYLKRPLEPLITGGEQEGGIRPGTENTAGALALAACLEEHAPPAKPGEKAAGEAAAEKRWSRLIINLKRNPRCVLVPEDRAEIDSRFSPWILQARFKDVPGEVMVRALDSEGIAVSTGSACSSASPERPVLAAMGLDDRARLEGIRISQGWSTTIEDIDALLGGIEKALAFL
jgi:cysteine desulfurase